MGKRITLEHRLTGTYSSPNQTKSPKHSTFMLCSFALWPREVWQVITNDSEKRTAYVFRSEEGEDGDRSSCPTLVPIEQITRRHVPEEMTL
jgi:hypothetical protein